MPQILDQLSELYIARIYPIWDARFRYLWYLWGWVRDIGILIPLLYLHYSILYPILCFVFDIIVIILPYLEKAYYHGHAIIFAAICYLVSLEDRTKLLLLLLTLGCWLVQALYHHFVKMSKTVLRTRISELILGLCGVIRAIYTCTSGYCLRCLWNARTTQKPGKPVFKKSEIVCLRLGDPRKGENIFVHRKILENASRKLLAAAKITPGKEDRPVCYLQHENFYAVQIWVHWQYYREMNGKLAPDRVCDTQLILAYDFAKKYKDFDFMDAIIDHSISFIQNGSEYETLLSHGRPTTLLGRLCLPYQWCRHQSEKALSIWKRWVFYRVRNLLRSMFKMPWWKSWGKYLHDQFKSLVEAIKCDESLPEEERHSRWQRIHDVFWEPNTHYGKNLHTRYCLVCGGLWKEETQKKRRRTSKNATFLRLQDQRRRFRHLCDRFVYKQRSTPATKKLMLDLALVLERGTSYVPRNTAGFLPDFESELRKLSMIMLDQGDDCKFINPLINSDLCIYHEHTAKGLPCYKKKLPGELSEIKIQIHWTSYIPGVDYVRNLILAIHLPKLSHCLWPRTGTRPMKAPRDFPLPESPPLQGQMRWVPSDPWDDVPLPVPIPAMIRPAKVLPINNIPADNAPKTNQPVAVKRKIYLSNGVNVTRIHPSNHFLADHTSSATVPGTDDAESRQDLPDRNDSGREKEIVQSSSSNDWPPPTNGTDHENDTEYSVDTASLTDRAASTLEPGLRSRLRALSAPARILHA